MRRYLLDEHIPPIYGTQLRYHFKKIYATLNKLRYYQPDSF